MLPFSVVFKSGTPVSEQLLYAVEKAVISGQMQAGDNFPSVRVLSQELRINPNTVHKVITALIAQGLLEVKPGIGTIIGRSPKPTARQKNKLLGEDLERLVVEGKKLRIEIQELKEALEEHWKKLT
jgi:GntR family transcriptional regulator